MNARAETLQAPDEQLCLRHREDAPRSLACRESSTHQPLTQAAPPIQLPNPGDLKSMGQRPAKINDAICAAAAARPR